MNDEEMTWDAWLWVFGIALFSAGLAISLFALLGIALEVAA